MKSPAAKKLFVMMVLEFFIWGAWLPLIWDYMEMPVVDGGLGFSDTQVALVGSAFAIASILGIFFSNQFADRNFAAEKFMAFSHLVGGLAILALYWVKDFPLFFSLMLVHSLLFVPTMSVANSLAFSHLKNAQKEFGLVRMGGTFGWMFAAVPMYFILGNKAGAEAIAARDSIFLVSGIASLVLAIFSLSLPHTPPKAAAEGQSGFAWLRALKFLKKPFLLVLFVVTFIDSTIHNGYFVMAGGFLGSSTVGIEQKWIMPVMSIGQISEILTMAVLGWFLTRLGWKTTMILGILGHAARFAVFAFMPQNQTMIILVQVLHGICYAFFFATLYIFIDAAFPKDVRSSAQGLFNLLVLGIGDLAAKWIFFPLRANLTSDGVVNYHELFLWPTGMSLAAALLLFLAFSPPKELDAPAEVAH
ncbi:nucleoside transporter [Prosthecobacter fusiformis]|uniref:Nucleoside transporter n=1 Tax=Prosthecobacter fusiformis TaxID=48464 RepID=A0A4V3FG29_9BACT|nr:MFS transporter [Prosthecobacter fusiformis]TDU73063.1 nucleoside transporter [Prosthecobacter fusiformis]